MTATPFETLAFARKLREKAGFSPEHAEARAEALAEAFKDEIATKADRQILERDLKIWFGRTVAW